MNLNLDSDPNCPKCSYLERKINTLTEQDRSIYAAATALTEWWIAMAYDRCPKCGRIGIETTCIGIVNLHHVDYANRPSCTCGWKSPSGGQLMRELRVALRLP